MLGSFCTVCGKTTDHCWAESHDGFAGIVDYYARYKAGAHVFKPKLVERLAATGALCSWDCFHTFSNKEENE